MRITHVNIPADRPQADGLAEVNLSRLGKIVVVAGRNGSGKSRLLDKIHTTFKLIPTRSEGVGLEQQYRLKRNTLDEMKRITGLNGEDAAKHQKRVAAREKELMDLDFKINFNRLQFEAGVIGNRGDMLAFVPKGSTLTDSAGLSANDKLARANNAGSRGVRNLEQGTIAKIQVVTERFINSTHSAISVTSSDRDIAVSEYQRLDSLVSDLLGAHLTITDQGLAALFGFPIGKARLSDGQCVLLQLAVALHCQGSTLRDCILLLDEPENHLHPSASIDFIERLIDCNVGQLWIATHSVAIIAHFADEASLHYMDGGKIRPAGKIEEEVIKSLLGDESRITKQIDFLDRPDKLAMIRYASQCLVPPSVLMTSTGDPQVGQIKRILEPMYTTHNPLKVLDYGAGKGRVLANLAEEEDMRASISSKIDYIAFDLNQADQDVCLDQIYNIYGESTGRWFKSYEELLTAHNTQSFHIVLACNVLHEIDPRQWLSLFGAVGQFTKLLTEDGHLLLVEDQRLPVGEKAHEYGFIVLDTCSLKELFNVRGSDAGIIADNQRSGRLKAHLISKDLLARVTRESILNALKSHKDHAAREIQRIRRSGSNTDGRMLAFWTFQHTNTVIALGDYGAEG